jgi:hypothetical protein
MVDCEHRKIYENCGRNKIGVECHHPAHEAPMRITCNLVCDMCNCGAYFSDRPVAGADGVDDQGAPVENDEE